MLDSAWRPFPLKMTLWAWHHYLPVAEVGAPGLSTETRQAVGELSDPFFRTCIAVTTNTRQPVDAC